MNDLDHFGEKQRYQREKNLTLLPHFHLQMAWNWDVWVCKREKDGKERGGRREEENYVGMSKKLISCWNCSNAQLSWYFGEDGEWAYGLRAFQVSCPHSAPRGKSCTMQTHRGWVIGPHRNWERTIFPRNLLFRACLVLQPPPTRKKKSLDLGLITHWMLTESLLSLFLKRGKPRYQEHELLS